MTFVGKILVVVQVLLSIFFMAFAIAVFTVQKSWQDEFNETVTELSKKEVELVDTNAEFSQYRSDKTDEVKLAERRANTAEASKTILERQMEVLQRQRDTARTERDNQTALAKSAGEEAKSWREELKVQRTANDKLHVTVDDLRKQTREREDKIFNQGTKIRSIAARHIKSLEEAAFLKKVVRLHDLETDPNIIDRMLNPPVVEGEVWNTQRARKRGNLDLVEITIGSDDGLVKGHILFVYRTSGSGKYLGKIKLVNVTPDRAVGTVVERAKNGIIQRGDNVTTKLIF